MTLWCYLGDLEATADLEAEKVYINWRILFPITSKINALPFQTISLDFIIKLLLSDGYDTESRHLHPL